MKAATSSAPASGGHASGKVRAATSANSGRSASAAGVTSRDTRGSVEVPLGQVGAGHLVEEHDVGDQVAVDVPVDAAADGGPGGRVLQHGADVVGDVGVAGLVGVGDRGDALEVEEQRGDVRVGCL